MDIFVSGIPVMIDSLKITEQQIQFLLIVFTLASSIPQLVMGKLSDIYGRRPTMLVAALGFALTSYICTTTHNLYLLTLIRFFHGLFAATCLVVVYAIIRDLYHGNNSAKMYSYISCILALTAMLAPLLGASIIDAFNAWEASFKFLALFACLALFIVYFGLPETYEKKADQSHKLIDMRALQCIMKERSFWTFALCTATTMTGLFLYFSIGSILLMDKLGLSSYTFSILFGLNATCYLAGNYVSALLLSKFQIRYIVKLGLFFVLIGTSTMLAFNALFGLSALAVVISNALITLGGGLMTGPATGESLEPFEDYPGVAAGVLGAIQYGLPGFVSLVVTRFEMNSTLPLAGPIFLLGLINLCMLKPAKANAA